MTPAAASPQRDSTIILLACAAFVSGAALRIGDPLIPRFAADFAVTPGMAGRVIYAFSIAYGLMQLVYGPLGDRYGKPMLICIALFGGAFAAAASALAPRFEILVGGRIVWGMAAAGIIPLGMAWIGDRVPYERRQATLARFLTGTLSGMMAGQLVGGLFGDTAAGWRGAFLTMAVVYAVVGLLLLRHVRQAAGATGPPVGTGATQSYGQRIAAVLRVRWAHVVLFAVLAEGIFLFGPLAYMPAYLHHRHGVSLSTAAALMMLWAGGGLLYALAARRLVGALGERRMVWLGGVLMGAGVIAWWISPLWVLAGPIALLVGFGTYLYHNTLQTHATQMAPTVRGTAVALFAFCLFGGQALGVLLAGITIDRVGFAPMLAVAAVALTLSGLALAHALRRREQAQKPQ
ncbi:MAG TPA: MFS transporter [Burkholderiaceae bacterium]|nr:MFS transporter [Burkholderiaceae bacterium]